MDVLSKILTLILLIALNALFAACEIAVVSLNNNKVKKMAEQGNKKAKKLQKLIENPSRFFATIQIGVTFSGFLASASAAQSFATMLSAWLHFIPVSVSIVIITIILSLFTLVFGELVPKRVAVQKSEQLAFAVASFLSVLSSILKPFVSLLASSTNGILKLLGISLENEKNSVTEEEIRLLVNVGEESGAIEENQKDMINNIFEFDDRTVDEIMTHRTEISAISTDTSISDAVTLAIDEGYSRIPVFSEDIDTIIGIVYAKDLLKYVGKSTTKSTVSDIMRAPHYVPEAKKCKDLFTEMTKMKIQMAIIVDEYGGTAGLITMEDLIESILGDIQDEYDNEEDEIAIINDSTFTIDGTADVIEIEQLLDCTLPEGDYDTMGGFMLYSLGYIPKEDEHPSVKLSGYSFTVTESDSKRILSVLAEKLEDKNQENPSAD